MNPNLASVTTTLNPKHLGRRDGLAKAFRLEAFDLRAVSWAFGLTSMLHFVYLSLNKLSLTYVGYTGIAMSMDLQVRQLSGNRTMVLRRRSRQRDIILPCLDLCTRCIENLSLVMANSDTIL